MSGRVDADTFRFPFVVIGLFCFVGWFTATASFFLFVSKGDLAVQLRHVRNCKTDPWGAQLRRGELTSIATNRAINDVDVFLARPEGQLEFVTSLGPDGRPEAGLGDDIVVRKPKVIHVLLARFDIVAFSLLVVGLYFLRPWQRRWGVACDTLIGALPPMCILLVACESLWDSYSYSSFANVWYDDRAQWIPVLGVASVVCSTSLASLALVSLPERNARTELRRKG